MQGLSLAPGSRAALSVMCGLLLLQCTGSRQAGFNSCSLQSLEHWLRSCGTQAVAVLCMWGFPGLGIEPMSPPLGGRFLTSGPPGKPMVSLMCL